jgi:hypothetical protein
VEFARHCLAHKADDYLPTHVDQAFSDVTSKDQICATEETRNLYSMKIVSKRKESLEFVMKNLFLKRSSLLAFRVPDTREGRSSAVWMEKGNSVVAGHATVALGLVAPEDLKSLDEQDRGLLGSGLFDDLARTLDTSYPDKSVIAEMNSSEKSDLRSSSKMGKIIESEQGAILIRNSWGEVPGYKGYQLLTYDYLLGDAGLMSLGQKIDNNLSSLIKTFDVLTKESHILAAKKLIQQMCGN